MGEKIERKNATIFEGSVWSDYFLKKTTLSKKEEGFVSLVYKTALHDYSTEELQSLFLKNKKQEFFIEQTKEFYKKIQPFVNSFLDDEVEARVVSLVSSYLKKVSPDLKNKRVIIEEIIKRMFGFGVLTPLLEDDELEEIMVNGAKKPIFVFDRTLGLCKTDVQFNSEREIMALLKRIGSFVGNCQQNFLSF